MAHTHHLARDERRTDRAAHELRIRAAELIADNLETIAERRSAQHAAELERANARCRICRARVAPDEFHLVHTLALSGHISSEYGR